MLAAEVVELRAAAGEQERQLAAEAGRARDLSARLEQAATALEVGRQ